MQYGLPDLGLTTATEIVAATNAIYEATSIPLVVDGDTGYGNALNVYRTVRQLERAGASAIQLEDQTFPKKCGHFAGKDVISSAEMVQKIKAATDSRAHDSTLIIARTDAFAVEGLDRAIERANLGAGGRRPDLRRSRHLGRGSPPRGERDPGAAGWQHRLRRQDAGSGRAGLRGNGIFLRAVCERGSPGRRSRDRSRAWILEVERSLNMVSELLTSFENRQRIVAKGAWDELEERYRVRT